MRIAVIGNGPAGLMAAWAAHQHECEVHIFGPGRKSIIRGAQYMHDGIPGIDLIPFTIKYQKMGTPEGYATKLYGAPDASCSWRDFPAGKATAYPLGPAYDAAWEVLHAAIVDVTVTVAHLEGLLTNFDLVISTIPKPTLCVRPKEHTFEARKVHISPKFPAVFKNNGIPPDTIIYNGVPDVPWYRCSSIMGNTFTEYVEDPDLIATIAVNKPLSNDCDCWNGAMMHVGRYGKWKKGVLVHNAFYEVDYALQHMQ